jgi:hypothetical protein
MLIWEIPFVILSVAVLAPSLLISLEIRGPISEHQKGHEPYTLRATLACLAPSGGSSPPKRMNYVSKVTGTHEG